MDMMQCIAKQAEQKNQPENRWIPIKERKPDTADHVLVTLKWDEDDYEVCEFDYAVEAMRYPQYARRVIAWMPMPKPYCEVAK